MRWRAALLVAALAFPHAVFAQVFPALYDVSGVAVDDVLNVRQAPDAGAALIGTLAPGATGVEVVRLSSDGGWGLVNMGESAGWASMRFLARQAGGDITRFPRPLQCFGTEPFWNIDLSATELTFQVAGQEAVDLMPAFPGRSGGTESHAFLGYTGAGVSTGIIRQGNCGDGMSDRAYGLTADFIFNGADGPVHYSGCCSLAR